METIHDLFTQLENICQKLNQLDKQFADIYLQFEGDEFAEQNKLATVLENEILGATHETASNIGFGLMDLKKLVKFIEFRQQFSLFNDSELCHIIDNANLTAIDKMALVKKYNLSQQSLLALIQLIQHTWTHQFDKSYKKISQQFYAKY